MRVTCVTGQCSHVTSFPKSMRTRIEFGEPSATLPASVRVKFSAPVWNTCRVLRMHTLFLLLLVCMVQTSVALTPLKHMTNHCRRTIMVNESLILDLTENLKADRVLVGHLACAVTLEAPSGSRLYLHVLQLSISDLANTPDRLHIYEVSSTGKETKRLTPSTGLYGVLERPYLIYNTAGVIVPDFRSAGPRMRLDYQGKPTIVYRGFRVLVTAFESPGKGDSCRKGYMLCRYASTCVPDGVRCDTFPNCGVNDNSDERSCEREDVVTNLLEQFSVRTALIAGVTGTLVFLGVAVLVLVILIRYNRNKPDEGGQHSVRYNSRTGQVKAFRQQELTNLYAPPSYEDVMTPSDLDPIRRGHRHAYTGPPPAYSAAVAALVHNEANDSSDDEIRPGRHRPAYVTYKAHPSPSPSIELMRLRGACAASSDPEDDVRMHGTWPSDTDEEEEVRARRKRKGGKTKGKIRERGKSDRACSGKTRALDPEGDRKDRARNRAGYENVPLGEAPPRLPPSPLARRDTDSPTQLGSADPADSLKGDEEGGPSTWTAESRSDGSSTPPQAHSHCTSGAHSGVSETESQLASSGKRNSRTESNSPGHSSSCSSASSSYLRSSRSATPDKLAVVVGDEDATENGDLSPVVKSHLDLDSKDLDLGGKDGDSVSKDSELCPKELAFKHEDVDECHTNGKDHHEKCPSDEPSDHSLQLKVAALNGDAHDEGEFVDLNPIPREKSVVTA